MQIEHRDKAPDTKQNLNKPFKWKIQMLCMTFTWHSWFVNDNHSKRLWKNLDHEVTSFLKISQYMHSLNLIFVLSRASCLSSFQANHSAYALSSKSSPFLPALLQELFSFSVPWLYWYQLYNPFLCTLIQSPRLSINVSVLYLLNYCPSFLHKTSQKNGIHLLPLFPNSDFLSICNLASVPLQGHNVISW